jgi:inosine-uridine nucleoside N-ribohydrolase
MNKNRLLYSCTHIFLITVAIKILGVGTVLGNCNWNKKESNYKEVASPKNITDKCAKQKEAVHPTRKAWAYIPKIKSTKMHIWTDATEYWIKGDWFTPSV